MKILYSIFTGMMMVGIPAFILELFHPNAIDSVDPESVLMGMVILFFIGCIIGWFDAGRKQRKKEEEKKRQAEQDRTNELMREYLEKKLREENENGK